MSSILQSCSLLLIAFSWMFTFMVMVEPLAAVKIFRPSQWALAHATFYGDETASATMGMLCQLIPYPGSS